MTFHHQIVLHHHLQDLGYVLNVAVKDIDRNRILTQLVQVWLLIITLVAQVALSVVKLPIITIIVAQSVNVIDLYLTKRKERFELQLKSQIARGNNLLNREVS